MNSNNKSSVSTITTTPEQPTSHSLRQHAAPAGFAGSAGNPVGASSSSSSMALSVTRHALISPVEHFRNLLCGIDSLDLGLFVKWETNWNDVNATLGSKKQEALEKSGVIDTTDIGREFLHLPSGKPPNYRYHLQFTEFHLYIAISAEYRHTPNVYLSINASTLWHLEMADIIALVEFDLANFGGTIDRIQPSRVDLCADFLLDAPPDVPFIDQHKVAKSKKTQVYMDGGDLETYYVGAPGAPLRMRIYDKYKESCKNNKQWFFPLWRMDDPSGVWRVEYQLRRSVLKEFNIMTLDDLWQTIGSMWRYLTDEWFSLRLPDNDNVSRRTLHPWWLAVQECGPLFGENNGVARTFGGESTLHINKILPHVIGRMITIAALSGTKDRMESIRKLSALLEKHCDDVKYKAKYLEKRIKLGYRGTLGGADDEES